MAKQIKKMRSTKERRDSCSWRGDHRNFVKDRKKAKRYYW